MDSQNFQSNNNTKTLINKEKKQIILTTENVIKINNFNDLFNDNDTVPLLEENDEQMDNVIKLLDKQKKEIIDIIDNKIKNSIYSNIDELKKLIFSLENFKTTELLNEI